MLSRLAFTVGNVMRNTGQAIDRFGCFLQGRFAYKDEVCRHRTITPLFDKKPKLGNDVFVAPSASVIGSVDIGSKSTVWYGSVLRGDVNKIKIGTGTSIGDRSVIHVTSKDPQENRYGSPTEIGNNVYIGQGVILHGCILEDGSEVGSGSIVYDNAVIGKNAKLAPGSLLLASKKIPEGQIWAGSPAKYQRDVTREEIQELQNRVLNMQELSQLHMTELTKSELQKFKDETEDKINIEEFEMKDVSSTPDPLKI